MKPHVVSLEEKGTDGISPWLLAFRDELKTIGAAVLFRNVGENLSYEICAGRFGLWLTAEWPSGCRIAFCLAYCPDGRCVASKELEENGTVAIRVESSIGRYNIAIHSRTSHAPYLHWRTGLVPARDLTLPFWPRDVYPLSDTLDPAETRGVVHATQVGHRAGLLFATVTRPEAGSFLYMQDLTSLNDYCELTCTSPADRVGGRWPELGYAPPPAEEKHLPAGKEITISDAYVRLSPLVPKDEREAARLFLDLYADLYRVMPRREALHRDWTRRVDETTRDLSHSPECVTEVEGHRYMLAYVGADDRPPEIMVQLALLVPMVEYVASRGTEIPLIDDLRKNLKTFYDPSIRSILRWLPGKERLLWGKEEHMGPRIMDSWYLHHPLLNLARLATRGDDTAKRLFLDSVDYAVRVAQTFEYRWPVFYDMDTLEILKAETKPGEGGEHDVAAQYAHIMLHAYDLSGERKYLEEAERAACSLVGLGFRLGYQFNATSFGAGALLRLWRETGNELYRDLSYVCLANIVRNFWLWECNYGHAKHYHTFMGLPPLQDAPYLAMYEEIEVLAAFHEYLAMGGDEVPSSIRMLLCEYCRYLIDRAWYHYPSEIPEDILAENPQSGHLNRHLSIPLEDIYDGWGKAGQVGQEVYGAAAPYIFSTRHCHYVPDLNFLIHCNYPVRDFSYEKVGSRKIAKGGRARFKALGDPRLQCEIRLVPDNYDPLQEAVVRFVSGGREKIAAGVRNEAGQLQYRLPGDAEITVEWGNAVSQGEGNSHETYNGFNGRREEPHSPKERKPGKEPTH